MYLVGWIFAHQPIYFLVIKRWTVLVDLVTMLGIQPSIELGYQAYHNLIQDFLPSTALAFFEILRSKW